MSYILAAGALILTLLAPIILKKQIKKDGLKPFLKVLSIVLFVVFIFRFFSYVSNLNFKTLNVKSFSDRLTGFGKDWYKGLFVFLVEWLSVVAVLLIAIRPYFKNAHLDLITLILSAVYTVIALFSIQYGSFTFPSKLASYSYAIETGVLIGAAALNYYDYFTQKEREAIKGRKAWLNFALSMALCLIVALPVFTLDFFVGEIAISADLAKNLKIIHRIIVYGALIMPVVAYFALRNKSLEVKKIYLLYFSLAQMIIFCYYESFDQFVERPTSWPIHLCHMAMYIVPICLTFKAKKLFYFAYFINVFGALIAMLMPNYTSSSVLSATVVCYWVNHYTAFFMPLLIVALKLYERPTKAQFKSSIFGFCFYFVFALIVNVVLRAFGIESDYFYIAGTHVVGTVGNWAEKIYAIKLVLTIAGKQFIFRPVYQVLFFIVYLGFGLAMWFVYELFFQVADAHFELLNRRAKIKQDRLALQAALNGRSIEEPMNKNAGVKLELKNFSKKYASSKVYAVKDASFEVNGGEIFGFLGPNGAGKSTIIKSIVGIHTISEGAIEICGYDCEKQPVQTKRLIGYVPDHYALYEKLTGRQYVNYIADIYGVSEADRQKRIEDHIKMFELEGAIDNPIKTYSHGMKQKITIMAALVHNPKIWILDEPLTGLDPNSIHQVKECMKKHAEEGNIVFFSSHIIDVVERICDRITIIRKGKIMATKTLAEIEKEGTLEEFYLKTINSPEDCAEDKADKQPEKVKQAEGAAV
ncbi:MAG: YwaF family protein [Clostridia bacterium]|nr:YwaF family protein [Clostridia bacterium]